MLMTRERSHEALYGMKLGVLSGFGLFLLVAETYVNHIMPAPPSKMQLLTVDGTACAAHRYTRILLVSTPPCGPTLVRPTVLPKRNNCVCCERS